MVVTRTSAPLRVPPMGTFKSAIVSNVGGIDDIRRFQNPGRTEAKLHEVPKLSAVENGFQIQERIMGNEIMP